MMRMMRFNYYANIHQRCVFLITLWPFLHRYLLPASMMLVGAHSSTQLVRQGDNLRKLEPASAEYQNHVYNDDESLPKELEELDKKRMSLLYAAKNKLSTRSSSSKSSVIPDCCVEIEVVFHIIEHSNGESNAEKLWTEGAIEEEMERVNQDFAPLTPFEFKLREITRTINDSWNQMDDDDDDGIDLLVKTLRIGGGDVLNIFVIDGLCREKGGFAQYPYEHGWWPEDTFSHKDRVFLCSTHIGLDWTGETYYKTVTHEIGHWLGLRHTFAGDSCDPENDNDYVDDTPQHKSNGNCKEEYDTCPKLPGKDPVDNFMNYSDGCRNRFTPGQAVRMVYQFHTYRRRIFECEDDEATAIFTVKFDVNPLAMEVAYAEYDETGDRDWRTLKDEDQDPAINYSNQEFTRRVCIPSQKMVAFHVEDENKQGFQYGGFVSLQVNGKELEHATSFDRKWFSTFVIADVCKPGESLFMFEIEPEGGSDDLSWEIVDEKNGNALIDRLNTVMFADKAWRRILHQKCLKNAGNYVFTIHDAAENGIWGFYKLWLDDEELFEGGGGGGFDKDESFSFSVENGNPPATTPAPTSSPSQRPTSIPTSSPVPAPTRNPTQLPTTPLAVNPTSSPVRPPTSIPTPSPPPTSTPTNSPVLDLTSQPTPPPVPPTVSLSPSTSYLPTQDCIVCEDFPIEWMSTQQMACKGSPDILERKCNKNQNWKDNKFCRLSCYDAGYGYEGDECCPTTILTVPPTLEPTRTSTDNDPLFPTMPNGFPTPPPSDAPIFGCFSGQSSVFVFDQGLTPMKEIQLGDFIQVDGGRYEQVYSFGHYQPNDEHAQYIEITTTTNSSSSSSSRMEQNVKQALQISKEHLIFAHNRGAMIPARLLTIDDVLEDGFGGLVNIQAITPKESVGSFAPFTPSGKLIVDGVLVSSYVAIFDQASENTTKTLGLLNYQISYQWAAHTFQFPHRLICYHLIESGYCPAFLESYKNNGINKWEMMSLRWGLWMWNHHQHGIAVFKYSILLILLVALAFFQIMEYCLNYYDWALSASIFLFGILLLLRQKPTLKYKYKYKYINK